MTLWMRNGNLRYLGCSSKTPLMGYGIIVPQPPPFGRGTFSGRGGSLFSKTLRAEPMKLTSLALCDPCGLAWCQEQSCRAYKNVPSPCATTLGSTFLYHPLLGPYAPSRGNRSQKTQSPHSSRLRVWLLLEIAWFFQNPCSRRSIHSTSRRN